MANSIVGSKKVNPPPTSQSKSPSKLKIYEFIIIIIVTMGGLALGSTGLAGYFHVGTLSNMAQLDAIIMLVAGGGILLIIACIIKNRKNVAHQRKSIKKPLLPGEPSSSLSKPPESTPPRSDNRPPASSAPSIEETLQANPKEGMFFGPEEWEKLGIEVLDKPIPVPPQVNLNQKDKVLLYIPQTIRKSKEGKGQPLTLQALKEIFGTSFSLFSQPIEKQLGEMIIPDGWFLIDTNVTPNSRGQDYETQVKMAHDRNCSLPHALEVIILNFMIFAFTGRRLHGKDTYIRCLEKIDKANPVIVGGYDSSGIMVGYNHALDGNQSYGILCVQRVFLTN